MINLDPQIWQLLLEASNTKHSILMRYYTASRDQESERIVDPYLLHIYRATNPYLIGFCHNRRDYRWFRVDRIKEINVLADTFTINPNFNKEEYLQKIFQYEVGGKTFLVKIKFNAQTAPFIRERKWHHSQEIKEHQDGSLTLSLQSSGLNDLKRWILSYGAGAIALEPPQLVELIKEEVMAMSQCY